MANAGNHSDTRLINQMIREEKLITISSDDHPIARKIKLRFNELVTKDERLPHTFNGKKYVGHTAWRKLHNLLLRVNQLRWKYFYFEPLIGNLKKSID